MDNNKKIIYDICCDNHIEIPDIESLENRLEEEMSRDNPDFDLIDEITGTILELKNITVPEIDIDSEIRTIKRKGIKQHHLKFRLPKFLSVAAVIAVVTAVNLFASLFIADGVRNFFPSIDTRDNKTVLDFRYSDSEKNSSFQPKKSNYNIIRDLTAMHGMNVYIPTEGLPSNEISMNILYERENGIVKSITFLANYQSDNHYSSTWVDISYQVIDSDNLDGKIVELSENSVLDGGFLIDGMEAYVFFDRAAAEWPNNMRHYTMYFYQQTSATEGVLTTVDTSNLDEEQAYKIFKSFK